jgi:hypothetical protein
MAALDQYMFQEGSHFLVKNEKMIILIQVLERGLNHLVVEIRGSELQEMTVCHAEESNAINEESEMTFEKTKIRPRPGYCLSPLTRISLQNYDDSKVSLAGIIDNREFAELLKANFMRMLAF